MKNLYVILQKLHELRQKSATDSAHYEALMKHLAVRDYVAAVAHITSKIKENLIFKTAYQKELTNLLEHYHVKSKDDAEVRLKRLLAAISMSRTEEHHVQTALETGCAIVVNHVYHGQPHFMIPTNTPPLLAALKSRNPHTTRMLIKYGANLDQVQDINAVISDNGETILHLACHLQIPELVAMALTKNADPKVEDVHGLTPLYIASVNDDDSNVLQLLKSGADPNKYKTIDNVKYYPMFFAIQYKNMKLVKAMLKAGYKVRSFDIDVAKDVDPDIYNLLKQPFRFRKIETIFKGKQDTVPHKNPELQALFNSMFTSNAQLKEDMKAKIEDMYFHKNNILRPLLDLASLAARSGHDAGVKSMKRFKVIMSEGSNIEGLTPDGSKSHGIYHGKNSIYVSGFHGNANNACATMLHEMKHFSDQQIYGDVYKPYRTTQHDHFMQVKQMLYDAVVEFRANRQATASIIDKKMFETIASIFESYKPQNQDAEVLVKVPEIIGYLGVDQGVAWLNTNVPFLLKFYEHRFNRACEKYLADHGAKDYQAAPVSTPKNK